MYICPYCNGLKKVDTPCPQCASEMEDIGKISDYYANYSPYREIEDLKMTNGYKHDFSQHECLHYIQCPSCGLHQAVSYKEEKM